MSDAELSGGAGRVRSEVSSKVRFLSLLDAVGLGLSFGAGCAVLGRVAAAEERCESRYEVKTSPSFQCYGAVGGCAGDPLCTPTVGNTSIGGGYCHGPDLLSGCGCCVSQKLDGARGLASAVVAVSSVGVALGLVLAGLALIPGCLSQQGPGARQRGRHLGRDEAERVNLRFASAFPLLAGGVWGGVVEVVALPIVEQYYRAAALALVLPGPLWWVVMLRAISQSIPVFSLLLAIFFQTASATLPSTLILAAAIANGAYLVFSILDLLFQPVQCIAADNASQTPPTDPTAPHQPFLPQSRAPRPLPPGALGFQEPLLHPPSSSSSSPPPTTPHHIPPHHIPPHHIPPHHIPPPSPSPPPPKPSAPPPAQDFASYDL